MTDPQTILTILGSAISLLERGIDTARALGIGDDAVSELKRLKDEVNASAAKLLPAEALALGLFAQMTAAGVGKSIDSMPADPTCPRCGNVLTRNLLHSPHTGGSVVSSMWCDAAGCGWRS